MKGLHGVAIGQLTKSKSVDPIDCTKGMVFSEDKDKSILNLGSRILVRVRIFFRIDIEASGCAIALIPNRVFTAVALTSTAEGSEIRSWQCVAGSSSLLMPRDREDSG